MTPSEAYTILAVNHQLESLLPDPAIEYLEALDMAIKALGQQIDDKKELGR